MRAWHTELLHRNGRVAEEALFSGEQNALLVANAERYYRAMFGGRTDEWNQRAGYMAETLYTLATHLERQKRHGKIVVWSHNQHAGDARATAMGDERMVSLGQLVRERCGRDAVRPALPPIRAPSPRHWIGGIPHPNGSV